MKGIFIILIIAGIIVSGISVAKAESQSACAIWLCLPGGFPSGCSDAYSEFKSRVKKGKSPLPDLSSCMVSSDGSKSKGTYQMGIDYFRPCKTGFQYSKTPWSYNDDIMCIPSNPQCNLREKYRSDKKMDCASYQAERRKQIRFIKMWVDSQYIGQFFY